MQYLLTREDVTNVFDCIAMRVFAKNNFTAFRVSDLSLRHHESEI